LDLEINPCFTKLPSSFPPVTLLLFAIGKYIQRKKGLYRPFRVDTKAKGSAYRKRSKARLG
jgi:hypothetical protein